MAKNGGRHLWVSALSHTRKFCLPFCVYLFSWPHLHTFFFLFEPKKLPPVAMQNAISGVPSAWARLAFSYVLEPDPWGSANKMLHLPLVQFNFGNHLGKKSNKVVTVQRQSASYFTYAADEEVKQAKLRQAALCQVYEDFTGISRFPDKPLQVLVSKGWICAKARATYSSEGNLSRVKSFVNHPSIQPDHRQTPGKGAGTVKITMYFINKYITFRGKHSMLC